VYSRDQSAGAHHHRYVLLPLTLSLSDFGIYFYPLARPAPRAQYEQFFLAPFLFRTLSFYAPPATDGRQAIAL
jgi:hypothetical protein